MCVRGSQSKWRKAANYSYGRASFYKNKLEQVSDTMTEVCYHNDQPAWNGENNKRRRNGAKTSRFFQFYYYHFISLKLACSAGVFFGRTNVFARESTILKLPKRGGKDSHYFFSPQSSAVIKSKMAATKTHTDMNKLSPTQNTPALQATLN